MTGLDYDELTPLIEEAAKRVTDSFPSYVDRKDIEQAIHIWLLENQRWVKRIMSQEDANLRKQVYPTMKRVAFSSANKEKSGTEGYEPSDVYRYSIEKIQTLLEDVFDYQNWQSFSLRLDGLPRSRGQANETGDRTVELCDVKAALEGLNEQSQNLLTWRYRDNYSMEQLGVEMGVSTTAATKRHKASLRALQKGLGYKSQEDPERAPVGRRKVRSNAAWRAALEDS
jgi:DNA-directed RNA polymerase specialized sigma24 family protein